VSITFCGARNNYTRKEKKQRKNGTKAVETGEDGEGGENEKDGGYWRLARLLGFGFWVLVCFVLLDRSGSGCSSFSFHQSIQPAVGVSVERVC
jgi:hypothetical protein